MCDFDFAQGAVYAAGFCALFGWALGYVHAMFNLRVREWETDRAGL